MPYKPITDPEKLEKRRAYQRKYYRQRRAGERALRFLLNREEAQKAREQRKRRLFSN